MDKDMQDVTLTLLVKRSLVPQLTKDTVHVSVDLRDIRSSAEHPVEHLRRGFMCR